MLDNEPWNFVERCGTSWNKSLFPLSLPYNSGNFPEKLIFQCTGRQCRRHVVLCPLALCIRSPLLRFLQSFCRRLMQNAVFQKSVFPRQPVPNAGLMPISQVVPIGPVNNGINTNPFQRHAGPDCRCALASDKPKPVGPVFFGMGRFGKRNRKPKTRIALMPSI